MLIAQQKKEENIAEYVLYMFQLQDLIRGCNFDFDQIRTKLIIPQTPSESLIPRSEAWFKEIVDEMERRSLQKKGHIHEIQEVINEIVYLHNTLIDVVKDKKYVTLFEAAKEPIEAFRKKSDLAEKHPIEICFHALYMKLLLKLQQKEINAETEAAFDAMRIVLAYLTKGYHQMKSGNMEMFTPSEN